ncbi:hypothetical protein CCAX7_48120 [Capsulimonas corticalis]|uniref:Uncharacterized protein n=1 Tax=Capsulimonas corticalis TaxID=2219043 RepID=A0A402CQA5_9BACT|nr:VanW family protein [Capsulimonas corticalis]BDI32761.1 hypothetical protein CCAX7_48120 [Capsulimonas corticalis]
MTHVRKLIDAALMTSAVLAATQFASFGAAPAMTGALISNNKMMGLLSPLTPPTADALPAAAMPAPAAASPEDVLHQTLGTYQGPLDPTFQTLEMAQLFDPSLQFIDWREVFNIAQLGSFDIPLRSDPAERENILLSAQAIDNRTVAPGQVFSFNDVVGERTEERGFQDGWMFEQGKLVRGTGGGICLVATGIYNAALLAGLGVVERHPHSGYVRYAPAGCDASVVYGLKDLQFRNTTSSPILLHVDYQTDKLGVQIFGTPPPIGYKVVVKPTHYEALAPSVVEKPDETLPAGAQVVEQTPRPGFDVTVERFFLQGNRLVRRELLSTERMEPRPKIVRVASSTLPAPTDNWLDAILNEASQDDSQ